MNTLTHQTSLYNFHKKNGAKFTQFANWTMPLQYTSIIEEHNAVRQNAGLFDISHMGQILLVGDDAEHVVNILFTNNFYELKNNKSLYTLMCNNEGGVVDDFIVYRIARDEFLACANASNTEKDIAWMKQNLRNFKCEVMDVSNHFSMLALQGPKASEILQAVVNFDVRKLEKNSFVREDILKDKVLVSRTGYTGEDGFELYCEAREAENLVNLLLQKGKSKGLVLAGLGCRDSLRLEMGYPLYGHEISDSITPLEANLSWAVKFDKFDKDHFVGQEVLEQQNENGINQKIIFFKLDKRYIPRQNMPILKNGTEVGAVTSGAFSPTLNSGIGSALIQLNLVNDLENENLSIKIHNDTLPISISKYPLYKNKESDKNQIS